ncbi:HlyD family type I secretion periplasmic adaptor subunit, partial [Aduncisulcus paluster]
LEAEARGRTEIAFPDDLDKMVPAAVATEASVFKMRSQKVAQDIDVLNQQVTRLTGSLKLLEREQTLTRKLYEQKVNIKSAQDRVRRTDLKAPVHGIVNKLNVSTIGAVVAPGANLMDIVPLDDTLLVEGRIRPQDIAFIRPNQDAVVKISAYDSSVYGSLKGKVERISADTIVDDKAEQSER